MSTITLNPVDYPPPPVSMLTLTPADLTPGTVELGAPYIDAETVQALHDAVAMGTFTLDPAWHDSLAATEDAVLETKFLERLRRTPLSPSAPALHHRRLALFEAVREIGAEGSVPGFGFGVHNVTRCIGDVETWLEGKRQELAQVGLGEAEQVRMLAMLTPGQLGALLQVSEASLAQWRELRRGPAFAKLSQRAIRYPVVAVLEWLKGALTRG